MMLNFFAFAVFCHRSNYQKGFGRFFGQINPPKSSWFHFHNDGALFWGSLRRFRSLTKIIRRQQATMVVFKLIPIRKFVLSRSLAKWCIQKRIPRRPKCQNHSDVILTWASWNTMRISVTSDSPFKRQIFGGKFNERQTLSLSKTSEPMSLSMLNNQQNTLLQLLEAIDLFHMNLGISRTLDLLLKVVGKNIKYFPKKWWKKLVIYHGRR